MTVALIDDQHLGAQVRLSVRSPLLETALAAEGIACRVVPVPRR